MTAETDLLPLPEDYDQNPAGNAEVQDYARANVEANTAAQAAEIYDLGLRLDAAIERSIESDRAESRLLDEIEALREQVSRLDEVNVELGRQLVEHEDRAERLAEALGDLLNCPSEVDAATVPSAGIEAAPEQVVFVLSVSYAHILKARAALRPTATQED